uniref:Uncharacterized protein n=1 Tax=Parazoarcus communis TaxID=41977 RepID=Q1KY56_9RHOO|nr:hypothetical protein [Parazoarcus communis]
MAACRCLESRRTALSVPSLRSSGRKPAGAARDACALPGLPEAASEAGRYGPATAASGISGATQARGNRARAEFCIQVVTIVCRPVDGALGVVDAARKQMAVGREHFGRIAKGACDIAQGLYCCRAVTAQRGVEAGLVKAQLPVTAEADAHRRQAAVETAIAGPVEDRADFTAQREAGGLASLHVVQQGTVLKVGVELAVPRVVAGDEVLQGGLDVGIRTVDTQATQLLTGSTEFGDTFAQPGENLRLVTDCIHPRVVTAQEGGVAGLQLGQYRLHLRSGIAQQRDGAGRASGVGQVSHSGVEQGAEEVGIAAALAVVGRQGAERVEAECGKIDLQGGLRWRRNVLSLDRR